MNHQLPANILLTGSAGHAGSGISRILASETRVRGFDVKPSAHNASPGGNFALVYIEHSAVSAVAESAFTIFVQEPEIPAQLPYRILQQDEKAHILYDIPTRTTAYVFFEAQNIEHGTQNTKSDFRPSTSDIPLESEIRYPTSDINSVSRPCFVMLRRGETGGLSVSVAITDFSKKTPLTLSLDGAWQVSERSRQGIRAELSPDGGTSIQWAVEDYMPTRFTLIPATRQPQP